MGLDDAMWLLIAREPFADLPYWSGRRWLAAIDAVIWPALWVLVFNHAPKPVGIVGPFVAAVAMLFALGRLHRALYLNHRYRFTAWRWGRIAVAMWLMGLVMKLMLLA